MGVVAITGIAGMLGSKVCRALAADERVNHLIGFDVVAPREPIPGCVFHHWDVRSPGLAAVLQASGVTTLVHLAFIVNPRHNLREVHDIDINGTRAVLTACAEANVSKVIVCSSTSVYGLHADNPVPLTENSPLRPNADNSYACHKQQVEELAQHFAGQHAQIELTVLRPCMILGPTMDNFSCRMARRMSRIITIKNHNPRMQFVHEDDVAAVFVAAVTGSMPGTYNVTGSGTIDMQRYSRLFGKKQRCLPYGVAHLVGTLLWRLRIPGIEFSPEWLSVLRYSCIAANDLLATRYGLTPVYSTEETLQSYLAAWRTT